MSGPCSESSGGRPCRLDALDQRVLGFLGLLGVEALALVGEQELDEPLRVLVVARLEDADAGGVDERARVACRQVVVGDRGVGSSSFAGRRSSG